MKRFLPLLVFSALASLLAGCAGTPKTAADDGEYEWVRPTGSNIAVKVRKGQSATVGTSPVGTMTGEQMQSMVNSAGGKVPTDTAGR